MKRGRKPTGVVRVAKSVSLPGDICEKIARLALVNRRTFSGMLVVLAEAGLQNAQYKQDEAAK